MHTIEKDWKSYNVFLPSLNDWLKDNAGASYCGISANARLEIHFTEQPSGEIELAVNAYWDGLTEEGEAAKWTHYDALNAAEAAARDALLTGVWDDLITAERKIAMGRPLLDADRESLLIKYPRS